MLGSLTCRFETLHAFLVVSLTFAFQFLTRQLSGTTDSFSFLACILFGRFLEMLLELHFAKNALLLKLFFENAEGLIDVVVANTDLHEIDFNFRI
ncbi:hypothetical protein BOA8489_03714 [Boseongicola aestuarii]|uniref:Uncharacterized protein n=1 Tax=Boseongicola aestuarii TaxID=1470561 RepID=A0A238J6I5_9RHOB|nr:hypothetical protein BOA8489_03714 [Boseongicola aestuarii]